MQHILKISSSDPKQDLNLDHLELDYIEDIAEQLSYLLTTQSFPQQRNNNENKVTVELTRKFTFSQECCGEIRNLVFKGLIDTKHAEKKARVYQSKGNKPKVHFLLPSD